MTTQALSSSLVSVRFLIEESLKVDRNQQGIYVQVYVEDSVFTVH